MVEFFKANYHWIFSGIGVALIGFVLRYIFRRRSQNTQSHKSMNGIQIATSGDYAPVVVGEGNEINQNIDTGKHGKDP
jgi:hypothetical protein